MGTVSLIKEVNVIALGICTISIDQAASTSCKVQAVRVDSLGLTSQPLHTQAGPQSLTWLENGAGSPHCDQTRDSLHQCETGRGAAGFYSQLCHHLAV